MTTTINASTSSGLVVTPDNSGTIVLQSNGTTKATVSSSGFYAPGCIVQVASAVLTSYASTTNSTLTSTGLAVSITPSSSSSKILITAALSGSQSASNGAGYFTVYRNSTDLGNSNGLSTIYTNATYSNPFRVPVPINYLDSPATTSSITYTVYFKTNTVGTVALNQDSTSSVITVMEVAQ